jgi:hypothetical protein
MLTLRDNEEQDLPLFILGKNLKPAKVDGAPEWSSSDGNVASLVVADDGMSAVLIAGEAGTAQIIVRADADLGAGTEMIVITEQVTVIANKAAIMEIHPGPVRIHVPPA